MNKSSLWRAVSVALAILIVTASLPLTAAAAPPKADGCFYYTVRWGDTLYSIAWRFGTTVARIAADNGIVNPNYIRAGTVLWICPGGWPPPPPPPPPPCSRWHIVRWGETLWGISRLYGVSPWAIASANHIYNLNRIYAGQRLCIP